MQEAVGVVVGVLVLIAFVGWCWMVVRAFKAGGFGWGVLFLTVPSVATLIGMLFASLVFFLAGGFAAPILGGIHLAKHDGDGKLPFALMIPGVLAAAVATVLSLTGLMPQE